MTIESARVRGYRDARELAPFKRWQGQPRRGDLYQAYRLGWRSWTCRFDHGPRRRRSRPA